MIFKDLFKKKSSSVTQPIYNIVDVDVKDLMNYPNGIDQLTNREIDGFIIRNVIKESELATLIESHDKIGDEKKYFSDTGMVVFPPPFSKIDQTAANSREEMEQFYLDAVELWKHFPSIFGFDFEGRVHETLSKISGGRKVETPFGMNNIGKYNPAGFKHLVPGEGLFKAHCGNLFHKEFPTFFEHMNEISIIENQFSYFIMLDPPKKGGELTLYDVVWENAEIRMKGDTVLKDKNDKQLNLEDQKQVKRQYLVPRAGDMIVFTGGRIWHKVELAEQTRRLTCGGFLTRSRADDKLYTWA